MLATLSFWSDNATVFTFFKQRPMKREHDLVVSFDWV